MKIAVMVERSEPGDLAPILAATKAFKSLGIELVRPRSLSDARGKADALLFLSTYSKAPEAIAGKLPVFLFDRIDGAQLGNARRWIDAPTVRAVIKSYAFKDRQSYNWHEGRRHSAMMNGAAPPPVEVAITHCNKIVVGHGFGARDRMLFFLGPFMPCFNGPRTHEIFFAGTTDYKLREEISAHRKAAFKAAKRIPRGMAVNGRKLDQEIYKNFMRCSRAVLSPWGYGEACYRDYEALLSGCILIKPYCGHIESWPDIYREGETYFWCAPDFSDLPEVLEDAFLSVGQLTRNYELAKSAFDAGHIAKHYKEIFNKGMNNELL